MGRSCPADPTLHHHPARAVGPHASRARGAQEPGICQIQTRGAVQVRVNVRAPKTRLCPDRLLKGSPIFGPGVQSDARRGERHREHPEEPGHREDDSGGLRHPAGHQPDLRQAGYVPVSTLIHAGWSFS